jgi:FSR family fosmidomycin resistance protein-like MFS transporter
LSESNITSKNQRRSLGTASATHFLHDGFSDLLYLLLPVWQAEFALSLSQLGIIKSCFSAMLAAAQIPFGLISEKLGERLLIALGTIAIGLVYIVLSTADSFFFLIAVLLVAGCSTAVQHPLCSSMVSKVYEGGNQRMALGIYNFSGDLGKMVVPAIYALIIATFGWQWAVAGYGLIGVLAGIVIFIGMGILGVGLRPEIGKAKRQMAPGWGIRNHFGFSILSTIGVLDGGVRTAFLTLLPFLLIGKGAEIEAIGVALALVFTGGAVGKFLCGMLAQRLGIVRTVIISEIITGIGILFLLELPLGYALMLLPVIGFGLNGTSSVLYATVADFVASEKRSRSFALFYTLCIGAGAGAPAIFGMLSDFAGLESALMVAAGCAFIAVPLSVLMVAPLREVKTP